MTPHADSEAVRQKVREGYGKIAVSSGSCCGPKPTCCGSSAVESEKLVKHIGYSAQELAAVPDGANMGLSCGNPNALAALRPGEVLLDLGSGGGFDAFVAGPKVGSTGRVIGVDMTPEMLAKARKNIATYRERTGLDNVEFRLGEIEHLPVADASVDVIISNCVINLSPNKAQVWRDMARVLKPGGRVAVSDLALLKPLPPAIAEMVEALIGCVAGAVLVAETERMIRNAGLANTERTTKPGYVDGMVVWQDPLYQKIIEQLPAGAKPSDYITSLEVTAHKPVQVAAGPQSLITPAVKELVALGAAIAANCEPCLKHHYREAQHLGVSKTDMASAVKMAVAVKESPHQAILRLADKLTGASLSNPAAATDPCCGDKARTDKSSDACCGPQGATSCCG